MEYLEEIDVLTRIKEELENALRAALKPETMSFVERYSETIKKIAVLQEQKDDQGKCADRLRQLEEKLKGLPPSYLFFGKLSARDAIRAYLLWAGRPTDQGKIAEALFFYRWRANDDGKTEEKVLKTVNASISSNSTVRKPIPGRKTDKLFYRDAENVEVVGLAEWLEEISAPQIPHNK